ncbi:MAG TPA: TlpA disulfide reductase family protein [Candidatus Tectomicrobia bacterium]|nr:TlpA disulfide reductase family protein [Candidatus Tectomicrobia bacterium]
MPSPDQTAQTRLRKALIIVSLGLLALTVVIVRNHLALPLKPPEGAPPRAPAAVSSTGLDSLFAALGIHRPAEPSEAPDFTLTTLQGRPAQLREFKGKLVLLNFWATWCAPCLHEMPSMERLYQTFKSSEFVLLAVSMDRQGGAVARPFVDNLQITFPVLLDTTLEVGRQYGVRGLPTTYLIAPDGLLIGAVIGARDWYRTEAKALIAGLLRQLSPTPDYPAQVQR